jgi:hypothetical protein
MGTVAHSSLESVVGVLYRKMILFLQQTILFLGSASLELVGRTK